MDIKKVEIICENGKTKLYINSELIKKVENIEFRHEGWQCPVLQINGKNLLESMRKEAKTLRNASTHELVEELSNRVGVNRLIAEPYRDKEVKVNGPATILVIID